jgi:hypothetical protein
MEVSMKQAGTAAFALAVIFAITPANAKLLSCTNENMQKSYADAHSLPDGPRKSGMMKEIVTVNTLLSKGDARGACRSYIRAQTAAQGSM